MPGWRTQVYGPAYLDRVLNVDRPLAMPGRGGPLDRSIDGIWDGSGEALELVDSDGRTLTIAAPAGWPGPWGRVRLADRLVELGDEGPRAVAGRSWHDDLGGMGAGFASAFGGVLVSALGSEDDPMSREIAALLAASGIEHRPIRVAGRGADWTLLVTSGPFGDKLPIGFRGGHAALTVAELGAPEPSDLRVVAALPNRLAGAILGAPGARVRFLAPAMRNMMDREFPLAGLAGSIDVLSCNRREWRTLDGRRRLAEGLSILAVTDGPNGGRIFSRDEAGAWRGLAVPAFPRSHPPVDTNRAGEAFAAVLITTLMDAGWRPGPVGPDLIEEAAGRASAASALVLDLARFGFPEPSAIDEALRAGRVAGDPGSRPGGAGS